jgi:hypothetical protein
MTEVLVERRCVYERDRDRKVTTMQTDPERFINFKHCIEIPNNILARVYGSVTNNGFCIG